MVRPLWLTTTSSSFSFSRNPVISYPRLLGTGDRLHALLFEEGEDDTNTERSGSKTDFPSFFIEHPRELEYCESGGGGSG